MVEASAGDIQWTPWRGSPVAVAIQGSLSPGTHWAVDARVEEALSTRLCQLWASRGFTVLRFVLPLLHSSIHLFAPQTLASPTCGHHARCWERRPKRFLFFVLLELIMVHKETDAMQVHTRERLAEERTAGENVLERNKLGRLA